MLDDFFAIAATKYTVPTAAPPPAYSSDNKEFMAQYFSFFSCEGQGLERIPGSNSCKDPKDRASNKNPLPVKNFLSPGVDPITGKAL